MTIITHKTERESEKVLIIFDYCLLLVAIVPRILITIMITINDININNNNNSNNKKFCALEI